MPSYPSLLILRLSEIKNEKEISFELYFDTNNHRISVCQ